MNDIYTLDLTNLTWTHIESASIDLPRARYFHSANAYGSSIVVFGGMGTDSDRSGVFNDVAIFDTNTLSWTIHKDGPNLPMGRYAHLAAISADKLLVIGGQDVANAYLDQAHLFDLKTYTWTGPFPLQKEIGAYRSLATNSTSKSRPHYSLDGDETRPADPEMHRSMSPTSIRQSWASHRLSTLSSPALTRENTDTSSNDTTSLRNEFRPKSVASQAGSTTQKTWQTTPPPIYIYSNYNFTDVRRELHVATTSQDFFQLQERSSAMAGVVFPPGLRFPTGTVCGDHMIVAGTYLTNSSQTFAIWTLNLVSCTWSRVDLGNALAEGSWNRAIYCEATESYIIFGNTERSLVEDYNHRRTNFEHIAIVNLESFGIMESTPPSMSSLAQDLGMVLLSNPALSDMDIITQDRTTIPVSTTVLRSKWPTFVDMLQQTAQQSAATIIPQSGLVVVPADSPSLNSESKSPTPKVDKSVDRSRCLYMPYSHSTVYALVAFLHTDSLLPTIEKSPTVLCALLLMLNNLDPEHKNASFNRLLRISKESLHRVLTLESTALVYETASLCGDQALQIRSMRMMLAAKRESRHSTNDAARSSVG